MFRGMIAAQIQKHRHKRAQKFAFVAIKQYLCTCNTRARTTSLKTPKQQPIWAKNTESWRSQRSDSSTSPTSHHDMHAGEYENSYGTLPCWGKYSENSTTRKIQDCLHPKWWWLSTSSWEDRKKITFITITFITIKEIGYRRVFKTLLYYIYNIYI